MHLQVNKAGCSASICCRHYINLISTCSLKHSSPVCYSPHSIGPVEYLPQRYFTRMLTLTRTRTYTHTQSFRSNSHSHLLILLKRAHFLSQFRPSTRRNGLIRNVRCSMHTWRSVGSRPVWCPWVAESTQPSLWDLWNTRVRWRTRPSKRYVGIFDISDYICLYVRICMLSTMFMCKFACW